MYHMQQQDRAVNYRSMMTRGFIRDVFCLSFRFQTNTQLLFDATLEPKSLVHSIPYLQWQEVERRHWATSTVCSTMSRKEPYTSYFRIVQVPNPKGEALLGIPELDLRSLTLFSGFRSNQDESSEYVAQHAFLETMLDGSSIQTRLVKLEYVEEYISTLAASNMSTMRVLRCLLYKMPCILFEYCVHQNLNFDGSCASYKTHKAWKSMARKLKCNVLEKERLKRTLHQMNQGRDMLVSSEYVSADTTQARQSADRTQARILPAWNWVYRQLWDVICKESLIFFVCFCAREKNENKIFCCKMYCITFLYLWHLRFLVSQIGTSTKRDRLSSILLFQMKYSIFRCFFLPLWPDPLDCYVFLSSTP